MGKTSLGHSLRRSGHVRPHTRFPTLLMNKSKLRRVTSAQTHLSDPNGANPTHSTGTVGQYGSAGSVPSSAAPLSTDGIDILIFILGAAN